MTNFNQKKKLTVLLLCVLIIATLVSGVFGVASYAEPVEPTAPVSDMKESDTTETTSTETKAEESKQTEQSEAETASETASNETAAEQTEYNPSDGIFDKLAVPFGAVIRFAYDIFNNYVLALLIFAIFMKLILFPLGIKQQKNSVKQAMLKPKEQAIRKRYAGRNDKPTQQKMQNEIMELYKTENFSPMSGCLPLLLQFPILFALYRVVYNPLRHVTCLSLEEIKKIGQIMVNNGIAKVTDLSAGDIQIVQRIKPENFDLFKGVSDKLQSFGDLPKLTVFGGKFDLSGMPSISSFDLLLLIPLITFITVFISMRLTKKMTYQPDITGDAKKSGLIMDIAMPALTTWFTFRFPAILGVYWIYQNLLGILQQFILSKMFPLPKFTEEDFAKAEKEMNGKNPEKKKKYNPNTAKRHPKSLHHIDDDDDDDTPAPSAENKATASARSIVDTAPLKEELDHSDKTDTSDEKEGE